jgi:hypothetical protein
MAGVDRVVLLYNRTQANKAEKAVERVEVAVQIAVSDGVALVVFHYRCDPPILHYPRPTVDTTTTLVAHQI